MDLNHNILIVEDNAIIALEIATILRRAGYARVEVAHNAVKAIDRLAAKDIGFAILDIHLGSGDSGIDVAAVIHQKYHIPYIFLTSYSDEQTLELAKEQAPYGYLVKPFQEPTLLSTISIALSNFQRTQKGLDLNRVDVQLTEQEKAICELLCQGLSYQQVADKLFISINTVRYHVKNLYLKFEVNNRAALLARLVG